MQSLVVVLVTEHYYDAGSEAAIAALMSSQVFCGSFAD